MHSAIVLSVAGLLLTGCAPAAKGPPTFVEQLERERRELATISEKWSQGQAMVNQGETAVKLGERLIVQGQQKRAQGETLIERGRKIMEEAEQEYHMRTGAAVFPLEDAEK